MLLYQMTRPISYLSIKDQSKWKIDWLIPLIFTFIVLFLFFFLPIHKEFFEENGIASEVQDFLQLLPGFYLAALAAIATFNKTDLDIHLPAPTPEVEVVVNGHEIDIKLTRRRMLSYLFGYLTFLSLALYVFTVIASFFSGNFDIVSLRQQNLITVVGLSVFNIFFWQMISVTVFGLYQLCDRIHQP